MFGFGADLIYMELALEVFSYVSEVTEGRTGAEEQIQDEVILEKIASMHGADDAIVLGSGVAALFSLFWTLLETGDRIGFLSIYSNAEIVYKK